MKASTRGIIGGRFVLIGMLAVGALLAVWQWPLIVAPILVLGLVVALVERERTRREIGRLVRQIALKSGEKLEVREGAWSDLYRALNQLLQQRQAQQRLADLQPWLPEASLDLLSQPLPTIGANCEGAVLAFGPQGHAPSAELAQLAAAASSLLIQHHALLRTSDDHLLIIIGPFGGQNAEQALLEALSVARSLRRTVGPDIPMALTCGPLRVQALPGAGLSVFGPCLGLASALWRGAASDAEAAIVCGEAAYLTLRQITHTAPGELVRVGYLAR